MLTFTQYGSTCLYVAPTEAGDCGWAAYLLPKGTTPPGSGIALDDALAGTGSFVFRAARPDVIDDGFLDRLYAALPSGGRGLLWLAPAGPVSAPISSTKLQGSLTAPLVGDLSLVLLPGTLAVTPDGDALSLTPQSGGSAVAFSGGSAPKAADTMVVPAATLQMSGPRRGCVTFDWFVKRGFLAQSWMSLQLVVPTTGLTTTMAALYPFALAPPPVIADLVGFMVTIDPSDPLGSAAPGEVRSALTFTGQNYARGSKTTLQSCFTTRAGEPVTLTPAGDLPDRTIARLVLTPSVPVGTSTQAYRLSPAGDFAMTLSPAAEGPGSELLCGLNGTETIAFAAGDLLRFTPRCPAYVPRYPLVPASATGPVVDVSAPLLEATYATSYASVVASGTVQPTYHSQPNGATLYGRGGPINDQHPALLDASDHGELLPPTAVFPLLPYSAVAPVDGTPDAPTIEDLERLVVAPARRDRIGRPVAAVASRRALMAGLADAADTNVTTPAGLLVTLSNGVWSRVLLGQNDYGGQTMRMRFCAPQPPLQQALSASQTFMVVTNPEHLGALCTGPDAPCGSTPQFFDQINIEDWLLEAQVGAGGAGDYQNVMIVKGRAGCLWDRTSPETRQASLISNPQKWTQPGDFGPPAEQLTAVSYWLQAYFEDAAQQHDSDYFTHFNEIAADPSWTGILVLRASIAALPEQLKGVVAGITAPFYAHHFAVEISQVANDPAAPDVDVKGRSSMFGLIHYVDPDFVEPPPGKPAQPLPPQAGSDYDFRVLSLKALFANTTVTRFESSAQLTLNRVFGSPVTSMGSGGNPYNAIILSGSYQANGQRPVYNLSSQGDSVFNLAGDVLPRVEITGAQLSTRSAAADSGDTVTWFALSGFMDFGIVQAPNPTPDGPPLPFDLLAYGNASGDTALRQGLSFANLGLEMRFPPSRPADRTFSFVTDEITFDPGTSTPRAGSVFDQLALELDGLVWGGKDTGLDKQGYLPVITDAKLTGVGGADLWYGLRFRVNLGSPGKLAGEVGLTSTLLVAWAPEGGASGSYPAQVGLRLPGTTGGASLISLENVLKLSIGQVLLTCDRTRPEASFLLMLTEIALRFLGLLKLPPSGSTSFYVFGNPKGAGGPSGLGWYAMYRKEKPKTAEVTQP